MGVGEASGMFPIDSTINDLTKMLGQFNTCSMQRKYLDIARHFAQGFGGGRIRWRTDREEGAKLLDPSGTLKAGCTLSARGDAGTGMVATNSVAVRTGNVSGGHIRLRHDRAGEGVIQLYPEIDMVPRPPASLAMAHANNCTSDLNAGWGSSANLQSALAWRSANQNYLRPI